MIKRSIDISAAAIVVSFIILNGLWIRFNRYGGALDIDEAGYLYLATSDFLGYLNGGIYGWFSAVFSPSSQAPIQPALASILFVIFGPDPYLGFVTSILCTAAMIAVTYLMTATISSRSAAVLAAGLVATCPLIIGFSRAFEFVPAASLTSTLALYCLVKSDRMESKPWSVLFGVASALLPLSRTMTLAFLPGLVLGALVYVGAKKENRQVRLLTLALSLTLAVFIMATWFIPNGKYVFPYLLNFGYGARSTEYGPAGISIFSILGWHRTATDFFHAIQFPLAVIVLIGIIGASLSAARAQYSDLLKSPQIPLIVFVLFAFAALSSSSNRGWGFLGPLISPVMIIAAIGITKIFREYPAYKAISLTSLSALCALPVLLMTIAPDRQFLAKIPSVGDVTMIDTRSNLLIYQSASGEPTASLETGKAWRRLSETLAFKYRNVTAIAFGTRHLFFNTNTLSLDQLRLLGRGISNYQFDPVGERNDLPRYIAWLTSPPVSTSCVLFTSTSKTGDFFTKTFDHVAMEQAAKAAGFQRADSMAMPNGALLEVWKRLTRECLKEWASNFEDQKSKDLAKQ
ncbi:ArnT family glycosyltransferase [Hyphomicrobium sp. MC8b]|uniref:ArnT family glycosyltransferase n=1 Tax=Hyphomicrobium sp. MC8b TaxID=300273 RepID=UPI0039190670